jgi:hypothetical protein
MYRILIASTLIFSACTVDQEPVDPETHAHAEDQLVAELKLGEGSTARFFASEDGSAGVLESVTSGPAVITGELAQLHDLDSIAELYWALSDEGTEVPELLLRHHSAMADDAGRAHIFASERGSLRQRYETRLRLFDGTGPCLNAEFNANHCAIAGYPDGPACIFDTAGDPSWFTGHTTRFKAGFCLSSGQAHSSLTYNHTFADCNSCRALHGVWGGFLHPGPYSAQTYFTWTWIGPSGAQKRTWDHESDGLAGAVYDWATRFDASNSCDAI